VLLPKPILKKKNYISLIRGSLFEGFSIPIPVIIQIVLRYRTRTQTHVIKRKLKVGDRIIERLLAKLTSLNPSPKFINSKLGIPNKKVQFDETMLNHPFNFQKCLSPTNRADSFCIVECSGGSIRRCFPRIKGDKSQAKFVPIIRSQVFLNRLIHTDEH
jgi:hypothetical protein